MRKEGGQRPQMLKLSSSTRSGHRFRWFGQHRWGVPKVLWEKTNPADSSNKIEMSARCLLIEDGKRLILVDAGLGNKQSERFFSHYSRFGDATLESSLKLNGFSTDDVTDVLFTHLHFDH